MHENRWGMGSFQRARHAEMNLGLSAPFRVIPTDDFEYKYMITQWRTEPAISNTPKKTFRGSACECFALYFSLIHSRFGPTSIYPHISSGTPRCWWGPCCRTLSCWPSSPWVLHWSSWPHFAGSPRETCRKFWSEPRECLRMILGSNSNIKLVFVLWLKSNYTHTHIYIYVRIDKYIYIYICMYRYVYRDPASTYKK